MKNISLLACFLFIFSSASYARMPARGKMTATVNIEAPAEQVWEIIKDFDDMSWHAGIKNTEGAGGNSKGATRVLRLGDGTITEELKRYDAKKMSYKYKITDMSVVKTIQYAGQAVNIPVLPVEHYYGLITVTEEGSTVTVTWIATYFRAYQNKNRYIKPPAELNEHAANETVEKTLKEGLTSLLHKFEPNTNKSVKIRLQW